MRVQGPHRFTCCSYTFGVVLFFTLTLCLAKPFVPESSITTFYHNRQKKNSSQKKYLNIWFSLLFTVKWCCYILLFFTKLPLVRIIH